MNMRWAWTLPVLSSLAALGITAPAAAQFDPAQAGMMSADPAAQAQFYGQAMMPPGAMMAPGMYPPGGMYPQMGMMPGGPPGAMPGGMPGGMPGPMPMGSPDAYGGYGSMPNDYGMQGPTGDNGCPYCNGNGCDFCHGMPGHHGRGWLGDGLLGEVLGLVAPYPDGGCAAVRWYDFALDYMSLKRDDAGRNIPIASRGVGGPIVLATDDLDFDYEPSFRFSAAMQIGPGSSLEFTYFGLFDYNATASRRNPNNNLFSVVSDFGLLPFGGFPETDNSNFQRIDYASTFDSFEISWRQRWMAPNCRYQGSWLLGVRHFILDENFRYYTQSPLTVNNNLEIAQARFNTDTTNNLTGFQFGGDMWICVMPGLRVGADLRAGVYGNHMNVNTNVFTNTGFTTTNPFNEQLVVNDVSFIGQAEFMFTYRINYQWTLRGGYQLLVADGVALATENFNTVPPFGPTPRVPAVNDDGNAFFHGYNIGLEFMW
jgi:Putative beta barrel porin-7 (BBP7)